MSYNELAGVWVSEDANPMMCNNSVAYCKDVGILIFDSGRVGRRFSIVFRLHRCLDLKWFRAPRTTVSLIDAGKNFDFLSISTLLLMIMKLIY